MRFESKHRFFKKTIRHLNNFINIVESLNVKHELHQSLIRLGADKRLETEIYKLCDFNLDLYQRYQSGNYQNERTW